MFTYYYLFSEASICKKAKVDEDYVNKNTLVQKYGTKLGNIVFYLKKLWYQSPATKVIIYSQVCLSLLFIFYFNFFD